MTQTIPAAARLRRRWSRQKIGYRILDISRNPAQPFTTQNVVETGIAAHFAAVGGVEAPDAGGYIVWGLADFDIAEATIAPAPTVVVQPLMGRLKASFEALAKRIVELLPEPAPVIVEPTPVVMDTAPFEAGVQSLRTDLVSMTQLSGEQQAIHLAVIRDRLENASQIMQRLAEVQGGSHEATRAQLTELSAALCGLGEAMASRINGAQDGNRAVIMEQFGELLPMLAQLGELHGIEWKAVSLRLDELSQAVDGKFDALHAEIERTNTETAAVRDGQRQTQRKHIQSLQLIEQFVHQIEQTNGDS
jgi:hypothetical protein